MREIDGNRLKNARLSKSLSEDGLAKALCLSSKHIKQLEDGGTSAFFSHAHKLQVAKKVGQFLGLNEEDFCIKSQAQKDVGQKIAEAPKEVFEIKPASPENIVASNGANVVTKTLQAYSKKDNFLRGILLVGVVTIIGAVALIYSASDQIIEFVQSKNTNAPAVEVSQKEEVQPAVVEIDICDITVASQQPALMTNNATKPGNFVYLTSKTTQEVCIVDSANKASRSTITADGNFSVGGMPPFVINAKDLANLSVYYQGGRVKIPPEVISPFVIKPAPYKPAEE